ncbi:MAG TPA: hypothetical protein VFH06_01655 [Candidatus Saccharimonadales bacterium]|nr:hypothetical protein [Candidatus Saccharimonadales bacterium]
MKELLEWAHQKDAHFRTTLTLLRQSSLNEVRHQIRLGAGDGLDFLPNELEALKGNVVSTQRIVHEPFDVGGRELFQMPPLPRLLSCPSKCLAHLFNTIIIGVLGSEIVATVVDAFTQ